MKEDDEEKNNKNEISTSINILKEKEEEIHNDSDNENKINNEKDDKITLEDIEKIIIESDEQEREKEKEQNKEKIIKQEEKEGKLIGKRNNKSSKDEMLETEMSMIRKQSSNYYLMVNNHNKSIESEEETYQNTQIIKTKKRTLYKFVGRTLFLFLDKYEDPLLIIGPHWPLYVCFCGIISLIMIGVYLTLWKYLGIIMRILGHICFWVYFISYTHCSLYNPGYPKNDIGRKFGYPRPDYYFCSNCQFYVKKNKYVTHCNDCDICIENQDHHCPWTGHCIGKNNYYTFMIFIGASFSIIIYLATAIFLGVSHLNKKHKLVF